MLNLLLDMLKIEHKNFRTVLIQIQMFFVVQENNIIVTF